MAGSWSLEMTMTLHPQPIITSSAMAPSALSPSSPTATASTSALSPTTTHSCPNCGWHDPSLSFPSPSAPVAPSAAPFAGAGAAEEDAHMAAALLEAAQRQIADLQAQVRLLNQKATAAVDRWADYEDELARLRASPPVAQMTGGGSPTSAASPHHHQPPPPPTTTPSPSRSSFLPAGAGARLSALLAPRKSTPNLRTSAPPPAPPSPQWQPHAPPPIPQPLASPAPTTDSLLEALEREQSLRRAAEGRLSATSREVEELSVSLFEQANEMVATERRARARLEERVEVLERRDVEKKRRLERLESAVGRIERVKNLLAATAPVAAAHRGEGGGVEGRDKGKVADVAVGA